MRVGWLVFGVGCVVMGCSGEVDTSPSSSDVAVTQESFPQQYAEQYCRLQKPCCEAARGVVVPGCVQQATADVRMKLDERLAVKNVVFDLAVAESCIHALSKRASCHEVGKNDGAVRCYDVVHGTIGPGEPCDSVEECSAPPVGYVGCARLGGGTESRCRQFHETAETGEACFPESDVFGGSEGSVVECKEGTNLCPDGTCLRAPEVGESCTNFPPCAGESLCSIEVGAESGKCVALLHEGEACSIDGWPCADSTLCKDGICTQRPYLFSFPGEDDTPGCEL